MTETTKQRVAVLGAGPMGLAVAHQLIADGHVPVVYEAADRVGGMTVTFDFDGTVIERFYHFHCTSDTGFLQMLDELGIADKMRWVNTKMGLYYGGEVQQWGNPVALLKFRGMSMWSKFRYGLHAFSSVKRNDWTGLDDQEAKSWVKKWVGQQAYDVTWAKLFDLKFYDYADNLSAAWIWSRVRRIGRSRENLMKEKLGHLEGGSDTLLSALQQRIEEHGELRLSTPVERVEIVDGKAQGVIVDGELERFDRVISTIPLPFVPRLVPDLPEPLLEQYRALKNVAVVCVIAKLKKQLTENFWLNVNDPDMDIPGLVEYSNLRPLDSHVVYVPFYMPGEHPKYHEDDEVFTDKVKRYLQTINPELDDDDIVAIRASRYRWSQPVCGPNFLETLPPWDLPQVEGLWIADTSYYYPEDRGISESFDFGRMMAKRAIATKVAKQPAGVGW